MYSHNWFLVPAWCFAIAALVCRHRPCACDPPRSPRPSWPRVGPCSSCSCLVSSRPVTNRNTSEPRMQSSDMSRGPVIFAGRTVLAERLGVPPDVIPETQAREAHNAVVGGREHRRPALASRFLCRTHYQRCHPRVRTAGSTAPRFARGRRRHTTSTAPPPGRAHRGAAVPAGCSRDSSLTAGVTADGPDLLY